MQAKSRKKLERLIRPAHNLLEIEREIECSLREANDVRQTIRSVVPGRATRSALIVHDLGVIEVIARERLGKITGHYVDFDEAKTDGFTDKDVEAHVNWDI